MDEQADITRWLERACESDAALGRLFEAVHQCLRAIAYLRPWRRYLDDTLNAVLAVLALQRLRRFDHALMRSVGTGRALV